MAANVHAPKRGHIEELVTLWFLVRMIGVLLVDGCCVFQVISGSKRRVSGSLVLNMTTPTISDIIILFRCVPVLNDGL